MALIVSLHVRIRTILESHKETVTETVQTGSLLITTG